MVYSFCGSLSASLFVQNPPSRICSDFYSIPKSSIAISIKMSDEDQQIRVLYDLCTMIIHVLRSPRLPTSFPSLSLVPTPPAQVCSTSRPVPPHVSPAAFGALFLGISFALMLFGAVTFMIGFVLMPLVVTLVLLFYSVVMVLNLSEVGRAILWPASAAVKVAPEPIFDDER